MRRNICSRSDLSGFGFVFKTKVGNDIATFKLTKPLKSFHSSNCVDEVFYRADGLEDSRPALAEYLRELFCKDARLCSMARCELLELRREPLTLLCSSG